MLNGLLLFISYFVFDSISIRFIYSRDEENADRPWLVFDYSLNSFTPDGFLDIRINLIFD